VEALPLWLSVLERRAAIWCPRHLVDPVRAFDALVRRPSATSIGVDRADRRDRLRNRLSRLTHQVEVYSDRFLDAMLDFSTSGPVATQPARSGTYADQFPCVCS
jgi:hypothetical protein